MGTADEPPPGKPVIITSKRTDMAQEELSASREAMLVKLRAIDEQTAIACGSDRPRMVDRHRSRGRLLPRERIGLLLDRDASFLELSPLAGWGTEYKVGAAVVTGIGTVSGVECVVIAHDPTVRGGAVNPYGLRKTIRAMDIARENRLPLINLVESAGGDLPRQADVFIPGGAIFRNLTQLSALRIPTVALVFGNATAGGAYVPGMSDYVVMVRGQAKVFLAGPPLVKMATGEDSTDEELGGAEMHSTTSGVSDFLALDELDCIRLGREIVSRLNWRKLGPGPSLEVVEPVLEGEDLLAFAGRDPRLPLPVREVIGRVVDGSNFDAFKPQYGANLVTGWAAIHGYPVGILANDMGILFSSEAEKAAQFIQLANQVNTPLVFLHNTTGYMVGKAYEQGGMVKDGAKMLNAVANSGVPHISVLVGSSYGAGNYGMAGRAFNPRFLFAWPNSRTAIMGPQQLAGVMSILNRQKMASTGAPVDEEAENVMRREVEGQIERESQPLFMTGLVYDDGIIDPRDTRTVLGLCLSACHSNLVSGAHQYGVFRM